VPRGRGWISKSRKNSSCPENVNIYFRIMVMTLGTRPAWP